VTDLALLTDEVRAQLADLSALSARVSETLAAPAAELAARVLATLRGGGKLLFCGNGGSAADAQHLAAEYVVRFARHRGALPAIALTTDTSILTAGANDYGFEAVFERQVRALGRPGDLLVLHSTSGESPNLLTAADAAREVGVTTVALLARGGGRLRERVDVALVVPTDTTARAQEIQLTLGHIVCDLVERAIAEGDMADTVRILQEGRRRERARAGFYRLLAGDAEIAGDGAMAERLNELLADEQHHVSRLTARLLEMGEKPDEARDALEVPGLDGWEAVARGLEADEVAWYERAITKVGDAETLAILREILASERHHHERLGGKWMPAAHHEDADGGAG
jgi:D-sedoheptulose 7-phosphate isomerase